LKIAVIDIGSNTIKIKIFFVSDKKLTEVYSAVKNTKLISYINNTCLSQDGIDALCRAINELKAEAQYTGYDILRCFATASLRRAKNSDEILSLIKKNTNEDIDLIPGNEEAFLSFSGVLNCENKVFKNGLLIDMGGGSTEIVSFSNGKIIYSTSMNFGSLSLFLENSAPDGRVDLNNISSYVSENTSKTNIHRSNYSFKHAYLVGGTALAVNKLYNDLFSAQASEMTLSNLKLLYDHYKFFDDDAVKKLKELVPERVTTVIPGLAAFISIFELFGVSSCTVTTKGIREGYVIEKILKTDGNLS